VTAKDGVPIIPSVHTEISKNQSGAYNVHALGFIITPSKLATLDKSSCHNCQFLFSAELSLNGASVSGHTKNGSENVTNHCVMHSYDGVEANLNA
jgi:hypothetical protein